MELWTKTMLERCKEFCDTLLNAKNPIEKSQEKEK